MSLIVLDLYDSRSGDSWVWSSEAPTLHIGRGESMDVRVVRPDVSQVHGRFRRAGGDVFYTDLNSSNGTVMDGHPLTPEKEVHLPTKARLWLGEVRVTVFVKVDEHAAIPDRPSGPNPFLCLPTERGRRSDLHSEGESNGPGGNGSHRSPAGTGRIQVTPTTFEEPIWSAAEGESDRPRQPPSAVKRDGPPTNGGIPQRRDTEPDLAQRALLIAASSSRARAADDGTRPPRSAIVRFPELDPGTQLGDYRIVKLIGQGGMGSVYEAQHTSLGKSVALKVLQADLAKDPGLQRRFAREAVAAAQLRNPHIVDVTHIGTDKGITYIVMELLRGESLAALIARDGPQSVQAIVAIFLPVCFALHTTHRAGVIHRDLKPPNIFLHRISMGITVPKVLDFGIMKLLDPSDVEGNITNEGELMGTPGYAAPEVLLRRDVNALSDMYSLGVMLYECLTGQRPFVGSTSREVMRKVVEGKYTPLRELLPQIPAAVEAVVDRSLQPEPSARFASVHELGRELLKFGDLKRRAQWDEVFGAEAAAKGLSSPIGVSLPARPESPKAPPSVSAPRSRPSPRLAVAPAPVPPLADPPLAGASDPEVAASTPEVATASPGRVKWLVLALLAAVSVGVTWLLAR